MAMTVKLALYLGVCVFGCSSPLAQANKNPAAPDGRPEGMANEVTVVGCLSGSPEALLLSDSEGSVFRLTGRTPALAKHVGEEISVRGTKDEDTDSITSVAVTSVTEVFKAPEPRLSSSFRNSSNWRAHANVEYGVKFAMPQFSGSATGSGVNLQANFVADDATVTVGTLEIPREIYPDTNFVGGSFALSVNPEITNVKSCEQFGTSDPRYLSSRTMGGIRYAELTAGEGAAGTAYSEYYFHTFQNGLCYEIAFEFGEYNTGNQDLGCRVSLLREKDELTVIEALAGRVSFFPPTAKAPAPSKSSSIPKITSFSASSDLADDVTNRGQITFSWSSEGVDYVELSYRCSVRSDGVVILEGEGRNCENSGAPAIQYPEHFNRSPNSSTDVIFGNFHRDDPISIEVTITPFSNGMAYPQFGKSLTINVDPHNPFPEGVPSATANMTILYSASADGSSKYQPGSQLTIRWTDTLLRDPCVDLYLVQDRNVRARNGGRNYISQIVDQCLTPASGGSYTWTIPSKYLGSDFRIYARTPGGTSSAWGPAFSIVRSEAESQ
jgi:hypothetical protein